MATKINPPVFKSKSKSYELYRQELLAWSEITELAKEKKGIAVALTLPEEDETKIREKVFEQIPEEFVWNNFCDGHIHVSLCKGAE